jgi:hypothetical protein
MTRPQKITLGEMRASGVRGLLIYCADYKCSHWIRMSADDWSDDVRLSDLEKNSPAPPAARAGPTSGLISTGTKSR